MSWQASPSIADRMRVVDFQASLRKQDGPPIDGGTGQMAAMPAQVTPPSTPPSAAPEMMGGPTPDEMEALSTSGKVYPSNTEALADWDLRLNEIATDITAHIGTISQTKYNEPIGENLDGDNVMGHAQSLMAIREAIQQVQQVVEIVRLKDAGMVNHLPGMGGEMPPEMGGGPPPGMGLQNMPAPGPAGGPPGANAGPMGGM